MKGDFIDLTRNLSCSWEDLSFGFQYKSQMLQLSFFLFLRRGKKTVIAYWLAFGLHVP